MRKSCNSAKITFFVETVDFTQNTKLYAVLNNESIMCLMCLHRIENLRSAEQ